MALKVGYFVKEAATNLRRNKLMTVAAILTAAVSLLLVGGVLTLGDVARNFTRDIREQIEVNVFLEDDITDAQQADVRTTLEGLEVVREVTYISKPAAFEEFKDLYSDQPEIWQNVDETVLPASFRVEMSDPERVDLIKSKLEKNPAIEEIVDQRDTVDRILSVTGFIRTLSLVMVIVLMGAAVLLISNATQLAIYARRREIEIMKLVGATNWFVRLPFMLEGLTAGLAGAVISLFVLAVAKAFIKTRLLPIWFPHKGLGAVTLGQGVTLTLLGIIVGAIGSAVAVRRFLEV